ncbi:hypothetical protein BC938DRAFT_470932 [Jimgerdemannia flammicorona]|uniref:Uncharacterized protein n=1 Tax=Jimgerdemannia flammicorona TaxID=994334 RepID=A0A433QV18_9FUNG|nr:hypothetical protein BC938DRAFT_470932 [Jimgerdemannia flammicorona]
MTALALIKQAADLYEDICRRTLKEELSLSSIGFCVQGLKVDGRTFDNVTTIEETKNYIKKRDNDIDQPQAPPLNSTHLTLKKKGSQASLKEAKSFVQLWQDTPDAERDALGFNNFEVDIVAIVNATDEIAFKQDSRMKNLNPKMEIMHDGSERSQSPFSDTEPQRYIVGEVSKDPKLCDQKLLQLERDLCYLLVAQREARNDSELEACDVFAFVFVGMYAKSFKVFHTLREHNFLLSLTLYIFLGFPKNASEKVRRFVQTNRKALQLLGELYDAGRLFIMVEEVYDNDIGIQITVIRQCQHVAYSRNRCHRRPRETD